MNICRFPRTIFAGYEPLYSGLWTVFSGPIRSEESLESGQLPDFTALSQKSERKIRGTKVLRKLAHDKIEFFHVQILKHSIFPCIELCMSMRTA